MVQIFKDASDFLDKFGLLRFCGKVARRIYRLFRPSLLDVFNRLHNTGAENTLSPVRIFTSPGLLPRVNLLTGISAGNDDTDSIAITLLIMIAVNRDYEPRIISESTSNSARLYKLVMECEFRNLKQIVFAECIPGRPNSEVDVATKDIYITTTWQATYRIVRCVDEKKVIYLMREDERKLCVDSTSRELCSSIYANKNINFIVVSRKLLDELVADGYSHIATQGYCIEDVRNESTSELSGITSRKLEFIAENLATNSRLK